MFYFIVGLFLGSFLNVVAERAQEDWAFSRSKCPFCEHALSGRDLIPLLSWIFLKGRCRYCNERIPLRYPLSELAFGVSLYLAYLATGYMQPIYAFYVMAGLCVAYVSVLTDIYEGLIYDAFTVPFALIFPLVSLFLFSFNSFVECLLGGIVALFCSFLVVFITKKAGQGDITFLTFLGSWLGLRAFIRVFFISSIFAGFIIIPLLLLKKINFKSTLPLVPFLYAGTVLSFYI